MTYNQMILSTSYNYLGLKEKPGLETHPTIAEWFKLVGLSGRDDSTTAWCAVFIAGVLNECKLLGTGSAAARSYLKWGKSSLHEEMPGDIVVLERGSEKWQGHVGIFIKYSDNEKSVLVRGGNQNNGVSEEWFASDRIIDIRRYEREIEV